MRKSTGTLTRRQSSLMPRAWQYFVGQRGRKARRATSAEQIAASLAASKKQPVDETAVRDHWMLHRWQIRIDFRT
jgi:hypothetical protein